MKPLVPIKVGDTVVEQRRYMAETYVATKVTDQTFSYSTGAVRGGRDRRVTRRDVVFAGDATIARALCDQLNESRRIESRLVQNAADERTARDARLISNAVRANPTREEAES